MRVLYFYFMKSEPEQIRTIAPEHSAYWHAQGLPGYAGGPFEDRSGGMITFSVNDLEQAQQLVKDDPFIKAGALRYYWVKAWENNQHM